MSPTAPIWHRGSRTSLVIASGALILLPALVTAAASFNGDPASLRTGEAVYRAACASCHGADGRGAPQGMVGFDVPLPDFTDCSFATREPDADWVAVAHEGGPTRGFSHIMPAFGEILSLEQLQMAVDHIRTFCPAENWPPGDLNLPRPLVTEKAYVEDEAVLTVTVPTEGDNAIAAEIVWEKRFGARNQFELKLPFGWAEMAPADDPDDENWRSSVGDIALGIKRALYASLDRGTIVSVMGEVIFPTGDEEEGFGKGTTVFEPFVALGQILPADFFLHSQAGLEIPFDNDQAEDEAFLRLALGKSFTTGGPWGRTWSPMVELLGARELVSGADTNWDAIPQVQITLNTRQHIMMNVGVRTPLNHTDTRDTQVIVYFLWDWFDGGLTEGW
jgi:mono/diheme cytochrome c family protein